MVLDRHASSEGSSEGTEFCNNEVFWENKIGPGHVRLSSMGRRLPSQSQCAGFAASEVCT